MDTDQLSCAKCGHLLKEGAEACAYCGTAVASADLPPQPDENSPDLSAQAADQPGVSSDDATAGVETAEVTSGTPEEKSEIEPSRQGQPQETRQVIEESASEVSSALMDSVAEAVIKAILAALEAFVKAVKELASKALDWIWDMMSKFIDVVFQPLINAINTFVQGFSDRLLKIIQDEMEEEGSSNIFELVNYFVTSPFVFVIMIIPIVLLVLEGIITPFTFGTTTLILAAIGFLVPIIISALGGMTGPSFDVKKGAAISKLSGFISFFAKDIQITIHTSKESEEIANNVGAWVGILSVLIASIQIGLVYRGPDPLLFDFLSWILAIGSLVFTLASDLAWMELTSLCMALGACFFGALSLAMASERGGWGYLSSGIAQLFNIIVLGICFVDILFGT